eukprot:6212442-Pleurochrysis_carterae.AAC.1
MENTGLNNEQAVRTECPVEVFESSRENPPISHSCSQFIDKTDTLLSGSGTYCSAPTRNSDSDLCENHYFKLTATRGVLCKFIENEGCRSERDINGEDVAHDCPEYVFTGEFSLPSPSAAPPSPLLPVTRIRRVLYS